MMNKENPQITIGRNITTIELGSLWLAAENVLDGTQCRFVCLQNIKLTADDIRWFNTFKIVSVHEHTNYDDASSIIFQPHTFFKIATMQNIFSDFLKRKTNSLTL